MSEMALFSARESILTRWNPSLEQNDSTSLKVCCGSAKQQRKGEKVRGTTGCRLALWQSHGRCILESIVRQPKVVNTTTGGGRGAAARTHIVWPKKVLVVHELWAQP